MLVLVAAALAATVAVAVAVAAAVAAAVAVAVAVAVTVAVAAAVPAGERTGVRTSGSACSGVACVVPAPPHSNFQLSALGEFSFFTRVFHCDLRVL